MFLTKITPNFRSDIQNNITIFHLKRLLLLWVEYFSELRFLFCHISEMCITTISNKGYMTDDSHFKEPMQMVELKLKMIIVESPYLINALDRSVNHPLNRKYSYMNYSKLLLILKRICFMMTNSFLPLTVSTPLFSFFSRQILGIESLI